MKLIEHGNERKKADGVHFKNSKSAVCDQYIKRVVFVFV